MYSKKVNLKNGVFAKENTLSDRRLANRIGPLSVRTVSDTPNSDNAGTPLYMAPECLSDKRKNTKAISAKVDMYSLGIIMFEMFYKMNEGRVQNCVLFW